MPMTRAITTGYSYGYSHCSMFVWLLFLTEFGQLPAIQATITVTTFATSLTPTTTLYPTTTSTTTPTAVSTTRSTVTTVTNHLTRPVVTSTVTLTLTRTSSTETSSTAASTTASTAITAAATPTMIPRMVPPMVPDVTVDDNTINIDGNNVTLTLSWGEPFNNPDPIVNYTVSCSGNVTCPPNFTTTDNTTRSYTITNLTSMTDYTFSVVATNSIGSGEAGVLMITTPAVIDQVTGVTLTCKPVGLANQCTVMWNPITQGDITEYQVYYNGIMRNVNSSTTTLTFTAPPLPDGMFTDTVVVMVNAINQYGVGPDSDHVNVTVTGSSVSNAVAIPNAPNATNELHSITVTCTIHQDSTADQCVVMAMADGRANTTGRAPIINGMAIVTVNSLHCGVTYNITAQGMYNNGTLVGPGSSYRNITTGVCPNCESDDDELSTELIIVISVAGTFIITLVVTALITYIITSLCHKHRYQYNLKEFKEITVDDDKNNNIQKFPCDDNAYENVSTTKVTKTDTDPAYETTSAIKIDTSNITMDNNPAYALSNF